MALCVCWELCAQPMQGILKARTFPLTVDPRLPPLGVFVKQWAQQMDIHGGKSRRLSTYALLLMVIQYLQCGCSPRVLPNLQARFPVSSRFAERAPLLLRISSEEWFVKVQQ